jgi:LacI family transcriptional regulator
MKEAMATRPPQQSPRIKDVAVAAGVSVGTVSNVLNRPHKVSESTAARVRDSIEALGFVRDSNARSLAAGDSRSVGLVAIDLGNSIFVDAARGAQAAAREAGLNLLLAGSDNDFAVQSANVDFFNEARVAGLLLAPMQDSGGQARRLTDRGRPVVLINYDPRENDSCRVIIDNEQVGYIAARHLIDQGCTKIALVGSNSELQPVSLRRSGAHRAIAESGSLVRFEEISTVGLTVPAGETVARALARRGPETRPDGVMAVTDTLAVGIIDELSDLGFVIPRDLAVMGCDHNAAAQDCRVPVTTVSMRGYEMGANAMRLLLAEIAQKDETHVHQRVVLEPQLIIRGSTVGFVEQLDAQ